MLVAADGSANGALTVTLPAVAGRMHSIKRIYIYRTATLAITGSATLSITTTNLPSSPTWTVGNAIAIGGTVTDVDTNLDAGTLISSSYGTDTTFVLPAPGLGVSWHVQVYYDLVT